MKANRSAASGAVADAQSAAVALGPPQTETGRMQEFLPGMRTDGVAEQRLVGAALEAIGAAVLHVGPAGRQVGDAVDVVIDDRVVAEHRADHAIAAPRKTSIRACRPPSAMRRCLPTVAHCPGRRPMDDPFAIGGPIRSTVPRLWL